MAEFEHCIPTIDLSVFLREEDEDGRKKAMETITQACSEYGFFQIVNHGISLDLMKRTIEQLKVFFDFSDEEKNKSAPPTSDTPFPIAGYNRQPAHSTDKNEYLFLYPPGSLANIYPENPPELRDILCEMFMQFSKKAALLENIMNECLGLPPNFLKELNNDRNWDFMTAQHYFPVTNKENTGLTSHEDGNCITLILQDGVGGLEVLKNGDWIPVIPAEGTLVVNVGDIIQVLSNKKFKSATHRVVRPTSDRYSLGFFHNIAGDKWVEPLPEFTTQIGEPPKYRGFMCEEYQLLRLRNKTHPPSRPEDLVQISHYAIN